ncbi:M48 family metallopeptidase [Coriobacteriia bacterium Es71-Z0120]|uniref:M48 metallopeptidase family protein n=1 Tax=Parvivirga hydrogeniphila TaxID=2939460 RepID=UPI002260E771|nr:M48 family metallopeptidase [Parvivirga hydrogeniphila]MCL4079010.1 M48 family metallopeptidase [Parvivirga hydrogeniphila]
MKNARDKVSEPPEELIGEAVARDILVAEVRAWARRIGVEERIKEIHIRPMKRKWASVSTRGRLTLNVDLFTQPPALRRQVIVHELVHLKLNQGAHNNLFRALVRAYLSRTDS